jgi:hypothetical protein
VRDARIPEPPETPSKSHDRDVIVPSESDDGVESALTVSPAVVQVKAAVGGVLGGGGGAPMAVAVRSS